MYTDDDAESDANSIVNHYFDLSPSFILTDNIGNANDVTKAVCSTLKDMRMNLWVSELLNILETNITDTKQIGKPAMPLFDNNGMIINQSIDLSDEFLSTVGINSCSSHEISLKQLAKDMERKLSHCYFLLLIIMISILGDQLIINGAFVIGSTSQLSGIIDVFKEVVQTLTEEVGVNCMSEENIVQMSQVCLSKASRTNSGSAAFRVLQSLIDPSKFSLLPMSTLAHPLVLRVSLHPGLRKDGSMEIIYRCYCQCTTIFKLMQIEKSTDPEILVEVIYLDVFNFCEEQVTNPSSQARNVSVRSYSVP